MMELHIAENGVGKLNVHILMESHRLLFFDGTQHSSQRESEEHLCRFFLYILPVESFFLAVDSTDETRKVFKICLRLY